MASMHPFTSRFVIDMLAWKSTHGESVMYVREPQRIGDVEIVKAWSQLAAQLSNSQKRTAPSESGKLY
jgi:hypothetical protein